MKFKNPLLVVVNIEKSVEFYKNVLGLKKTADFGANVTLSGGVCLQSLDSWKDFIETEKVVFGANNTEIYFEEEDFDGFTERLKGLEVDYVHPVKEHRWGQRVVRFYDPDKHIIEVGESLKTVALRFFESGMTKEQVAERMDIPLTLVNKYIK